MWSEVRDLNLLQPKFRSNHWNNDYCAFHFRRLLSKGFSILYSGVKFVLGITFSEPRKLPLDLLRGHGLKLVSLQGLGTSINWKRPEESVP